MKTPGFLKDARYFQITFMICLLGIGVIVRDFSIRPLQVALCFTAGLLTQFVWIRALKIRYVGFLSAIVTCFGLSLLLRSDNYWVQPLAAVLAMSAKFVIRFRGKHIFNPANLGVILALTFLPGTWVSPGQWGYDLALAGWFFVLGATVVNRAHSQNISWAFLAFYLGLIGLRVLWLGQPSVVWLHQLQNGALLLFTFFMISDPMTIPNHPYGRWFHAFLVAAFAFVWQFAFFKTNGLLWALVFMSPLVPLWDRVWPAPKYEWSDRTIALQQETS